MLKFGLLYWILRFFQGSRMKNREIIEELYRCYRDENVERFSELCSPSIIWQQNEGFPGEGTHQGPVSVLNKVFKAFNNEWKRWNFTIERILDAGEDVVVLGYFSGVWRDSGKVFRIPASHAYSLHQGRVTKFQQYTGSDLKVANSEVA